MCIQQIECDSTGNSLCGLENLSLQVVLWLSVEGDKSAFNSGKFKLHWMSCLCSIPYLCEAGSVWGFM